MMVFYANANAKMYEMFSLFIYEWSLTSGSKKVVVQIACSSADSQSDLSRVWVYGSPLPPRRKKI